MLVITTKGLMDRSLLDVEDIVTEEENARIIATEWKHNGELVRRDVYVNVLVGLAMTGEQEAVSG